MKRANKTESELRPGYLINGIQTEILKGKVTIIHSDTPVTTDILLLASMVAASCACYEIKNKTTNLRRYCSDAFCDFSLSIN